MDLIPRKYYVLHRLTKSGIGKLLSPWAIACDPVLLPVTPPPPFNQQMLRGNR